jgi:hypothetical protein
MRRRDFLSHVSITPAIFPRVHATNGVVQLRGPRRHDEDSWLDDAPNGHRVIFDTWMADKFGEAVAFAGNWLKVNRDEYGLSDSDLAVLVVARHGTTPFAFNDAVWTKYGAIFAENMSTNNKTLHPNPIRNPYAARLIDYAKHGLRVAVCNMTTRAYVDIVAKRTGQREADVRQELLANAVGNARFVPAGIVTVTRAQEHGYAVASIG